MKKFVISTLTATLLGFTAFAHAAPTTASAIPSAEVLPSAVRLAVSGGMRLEKSFSAPGKMTGWVLSQGVDNNLIVYTTADGEAAIAGTMLDSKGENLTKQHLAQHAPVANYEKMWGELEASSWVAEGAKGNDIKSTIYVFKDANCSYCHLAWKALQPYTKVGLSIRWVPVAFLAPDSAAKAAMLLSAPDPEAAIVELQTNWGKKYTNLPAVTPELKAKVDANNMLMQNWGFKGTPAVFYKDSKTGKVKAVSGMPTLSSLPGITGLPAQPNTDPELSRFK
jgi:thiol:disulfide interchange protein DsbG